jgi:ABC-type sugar transport system permease subunit
MEILRLKRVKGPQAAQSQFASRSLTPIMLYTILFSVLPMIWAVALSLFDYSPIRKGSGFLGMGGANPFVGFENFIDMAAVSQPARLFQKSVINTFIFALLVLPFNLAITLPLASLIESVSGRWKSFFRTIYFLPTVSASVAVALIWGFIYDPQMGLLNNLIKSIGLVPPHSWLGDPKAAVLGIPLAMIAVIITYVWWDFGYNMIIFIAALQGIPQEIRDSARVDGANAWQEFWHITLPLMKRSIQFVCVMTMLSSLQVFDIFWVMTNGGPQDQTIPMVMAIYKSGFRSQTMGWAAAISMVLFLIIFVITIVQRRLLRTEWEY